MKKMALALAAYAAFVPLAQKTRAETVQTVSGLVDVVGEVVCYGPKYNFAAANYLLRMPNRKTVEASGIWEGKDFHVRTNMIDYALADVETTLNVEEAVSQAINEAVKRDDASSCVPRRGPMRIVIDPDWHNKGRLRI